jgi:hypothetical protein
MEYVKTVTVSLVTVAILLVLYKFLFNPQVLPVMTNAQCPDNWVYKGTVCSPEYKTNCAPFDPKDITSPAQACNIARSCGTGWKGTCP